MFKENALRTAISLTEGMKHVQVTKMLSTGGDQVASGKIFQPVFLGETFEQFYRFGLDSIDGAEMRIALGDVDRTQLTGPSVEVLEQSTVNILQIWEVVRR